ncbi:MAG: CPBP family intramembrane glutamic endopeptidase [Bacteroidota bacterium]
MSAITKPSVQGKESIVRKVPLTIFLILAIGLTWIFMIADALGSQGILPYRLPLPLMLIMGYMPTLAAVIVVGKTQGRAGVRALFRKLLIWRVGLRWYLFALFALPVVFVLAIALYNAIVPSAHLPILSAQMPSGSPLRLVLSLVPMFLIFTLINGEELAWRGYATPQLQARYTALTSSLIMGVIWTLFHLPLFFTRTGSSQADWPFLSFLVSTVALTVLYTWMLNNTRGSVLLAYLFHGAANTWTRVFSIDHADPRVGWIVDGLLVLIAVIVVVYAGRENLSRSHTRIQE